MALGSAQVYIVGTTLFFMKTHKDQMHNVTSDTELPFKIHLFKISYLSLFVSFIFK